MKRGSTLAAAIAAGLMGAVALHVGNGPMAAGAAVDLEHAQAPLRHRAGLRARSAATRSR